MSAEAQMQLLGEHDGARWYWAAPGMFHLPGVYYWDGGDNVRVEKAQPAPSPQPAVPVVSDGVTREQINALLNDDSQDSKEMHDFARAILALRPAAVPMTDEEATTMIRETVRGNTIRREGSTSLQIVRATEAYYGITAQAMKET